MERSDRFGRIKTKFLIGSALRDSVQAYHISVAAFLSCEEMAHHK